eukprot:scaffold12163_cov111-Isochrysis_galbana.AAC.6
MRAAAALSVRGSSGGRDRLPHHVAHRVGKILLDRRPQLAERRLVLGPVPLPHRPNFLPIVEGLCNDGVVRQPLLREEQQGLVLDRQAPFRVGGSRQRCGRVLLAVALDEDVAQPRGGHPTVQPFLRKRDGQLQPVFARVPLRVVPAVAQH